MPNPNAIVSTVIRIEPPLDRPAAATLESEGGLRIELEGERSARLDPGDPRAAVFAEVLDGLSRRRHPVYLEVDPSTSFVTRLLIPQVGPVIDIRPLGGGELGVELARSHALHLLQPDSEDFEGLEQRLREALRSGDPIVLTEDEAHRILDVRAFTPHPEDPFPPLPSPIPPWPRPRPWWLRLLLLVWRFPLWPWWWWPWWRDSISRAEAEEVFKAMQRTNCDPSAAADPCIPFMYPDNGCWARAHEMCRLMAGMGLSPRKVWVHGVLRVATRNHPACGVIWGWHVAPTLRVRRPWWGGPFVVLSQTMVFDPSLFTTPVSQSEWKAVGEDPSATLTDTDASLYLSGTTDPNYAKTRADLSLYRMALRARSAQEGPPPYLHCP